MAQAAGAFDRATGVEHRGDGTYAVTIDDGWAIGGIPNGGYLLATLGRAALAAGAAAEGPDHPHVLSATALYVSPSPAGPAAVATEVLRRGRRVSSLMEQLDQRIDRTNRFRFGEPSGQGAFWAWLAFADGRAPDPLSLLLAVDAVPPATVGLGTTGWVPTLSLTAYVRGMPAPGPLLVHQRARLVEDELVDEVCDVWDSRGRLVAQATQLAAVRTEGPPAEQM